MNLKGMTIEEYSSLVSEKISAPGGGSVLALVNELAADLLIMVCNFTIGKKNYEHYNERAKEILDELLELKQTCHSIIDDDASAFMDLMASFKTKDNEAISKASITAALVPQKLYECAKKIIIFADELILNGNKNVVSDAKIAKKLAQSSLQGCYHHVQINIENIMDQNIKNQLLDFLKKEEENCNE